MSSRETTVPVYHPDNERLESSGLRLFRIWMVIVAIMSVAMVAGQGLI